MDERIDRQVERDLIAALDPLPEGESVPASQLVKTISGGHYPTTSPTVFLCTPMAPNWDETEGAAVAEVADSNGYVWVGNITATVPPVGTVWVAQPIAGGRWVMQYDGPT